MTCPQCGAPVRDNASFCHTCGAKIERPSATAALNAAPTTQAIPTRSVPTPKPRRSRLGFILGVLTGLILVPLIGWIVLQLLVGNNPNRRTAPPPANQPDVTVLISRSYMERAIAQNSDVQNPVIELASLPTNGAVMTLTMSFRLPLLGMKDVRTVSNITAADGKLVVDTQQAGLGEQGQIKIPGDTIERLISELITDEIDKRINSNPNLVIDIVRVTATAEKLQVDAALRQAGN